MPRRTDSSWHQSDVGLGSEGPATSLRSVREAIALAIHTRGAHRHRRFEGERHITRVLRVEDHNATDDKLTTTPLYTFGSNGQNHRLMPFAHATAEGNRGSLAQNSHRTLGLSVFSRSISVHCRVLEDR